MYFFSGDIEMSKMTRENGDSNKDIEKRQGLTNYYLQFSLNSIPAHGASRGPSGN